MGAKEVVGEGLESFSGACDGGDGCSGGDAGELTDPVAAGVGDEGDEGGEDLGCDGVPEGLDDVVAVPVGSGLWECFAAGGHDEVF